jgi:putative FmdB family regulatory protein
MPNYDYICQSCDAHLEVHQSMKDEPLKICPKCDSAALQRQIGLGAGIVFKGSGFYQTDYKKSSGSDSSPDSSTPPAASSEPAKKSGCGGSCSCHP